MVIQLKTALVDVCDTVVDLRTKTIELAELNLVDADCTQWDIFNLIDEAACRRVMKLYDNPEFWRSLPPVPGSKEGIAGLKEQGYKVHWLTSPWYTCENWEGIRRAWLAEHFDVKPLDISFTSEKFRFVGDILIDDRPKHVKLWQAAHPDKTAWIFDAGFNRFFKWKNRCSWSAMGIERVEL